MAAVSSCHLLFPSQKRGARYTNVDKLLLFQRLKGHTAPETCVLRTTGQPLQEDLPGGPLRLAFVLPLQHLFYIRYFEK